MAWIEAWVTEPDGTYLAALDRSAASPFRRFAASRMRGADPGAGSLEYHRDNALLAASPSLFDLGNLVWMRYQGRTITWVIEERKAVLDDKEGASDWVSVSGRGVKQLLADRVVWPAEFSESDLDPALWGLGGYHSKTDASAAASQAVVPVASTTGAAVGIPVRITGRPTGAGKANRHVGVIQSINAGVSITLEDDLPVSFRKGARVRGATEQWRRFVNRACGEMLWDLIDESNPRFATQIVRGTVETSGADGWTQDFRFDNLLEVVRSVVAAYGDVEMDGLTFNYVASPGTDRSASVIFEEGADLLRVERAESDRDTVSWVVAEGTGEGSTATLAVSKDVSIARRREAYLDAKDAGNLPLVQLRADAAIDELAPVDSIALEVTSERYTPFADYDLGDTVRVIAPSRGIDQAAVIVGMYLAESDDERIRVALDVNSPRAEYLLSLEEGNRSTASSVGVRNRQPQGTLTAFSIADTVYFDTATAAITTIYIPDRVYVALECRVAIDFDEYPMPVSAAASSGSLTSDAGGGTTSSSSSASSSESTSSDGGYHQHNVLTHIGTDTPGAHTFRQYSVGGFTNYIYAEGEGVNMGSGYADAHSHTMTHHHTHSHTVGDHDHSIPGHTHSLTKAATKEAYPASHSVTLRVYNWDDDGAWDLVTTISGITEDVHEEDLTAYITGPGRWRITLQSAAAQPNGGRLGAHLSGYLLGAIQVAT